MRAHLLKPDLVPAPEQLREYLLERRFWEEFGAPQPPLDDWPKRKVAEYVAIQRAIDEVEQERQQRDQRAATSGLPGGSPTGSPRAAATDEGFQRIRAQASPPPMPPGMPSSTPPT